LIFFHISLWKNKKYPVEKEKHIFSKTPCGKVIFYPQPTVDKKPLPSLQKYHFST